MGTTVRLALEDGTIVYGELFGGEKFWQRLRRSSV